MKISLVHDWVITLGGAEKCLEVFHELYSDAPLYTLIYADESVEKLGFKKENVYGTFLQKKKNIQDKYRKYLPFFPYAIEQFDLSDTEVILSSSHCVAKGVLTRGDQLHICYCHTPVRYAWDLTHRYLKENNLEKGIKSTLARIILHYIRMWDIQTANKVDYFIANSYYTAQRIWRCYRREATVIYPPVDKEEVSHLKSLVPNAYIKWVPAFVNIPEKLEDKSDGKTILYLGALHMPNNIYGLIWFIKNVWIKSSSLRKKAKFIVVGREPTRDVRQICEKYSIELYADVPDIRYYYERATLVINPIFHGSGVNVKTIEAIGYGKPLVTTSKGIRGTGLISGEHVLVADSSSNFEKAIHTLLSNKKLASKLSVSARQYILNNYNYESILKKELARFD